MKKYFFLLIAFLLFFSLSFLQNSNKLYAQKKDVKSSLASKAKAKKGVDNRPLAKVGDAVITVDYFLKQKSIVEKTFNPPTSRQLLDDLVRFQIGLQEAKKKKLQNKFFVRNRMEQAMYQLFIEESLRGRVNNIKVSKKEMKRWYRKYPEIQINHILIQTKINLSEEEMKKARKHAQEIYNKVRKSKRSFGEMAKIYSDDSLTKNQNGDLGWMTYITLTNFGPNFQKAVYKLRPNQISNPIKSPLGFHIVRLTQRRSYRQANKKQIRISVFESKRQKLFQQLFSSLRPKYKVKINQSLLNSM